MKIELGSPGTAEPTFPDYGTRREGRQTAAFAATRLWFRISREKISRAFLEARRVAAVFLFEADASVASARSSPYLSLNFVSRERRCYCYYYSVIVIVFGLAVFRFVN
jgi:hypothetical protein